MAAATTLMPAHDHGARVYVRKVLEEACERLLQRLREDDIPPEESPSSKKTPAKVRPQDCDGVQWCVGQLTSVHSSSDPQEVAHLLSETCGCHLLPPGVLEALAQKLMGQSMVNYPRVISIVQRVVLREEKLAAFFTDETSLSQSLFQEMKGLLEGRHWDRLRIRRRYLAEFTAADLAVLEPGDGGSSADPEVHGSPRVQLSRGGANAAEPKVHVSAGDETYTPAGRVSGADPEVDASASKRGQRADLAIGDRRTKLGFYIELKKNPKDKKELQAGRDKLRAILSAESVSAPGNFNTMEENRVCYQVIFYTPDELSKGSQRPEEMEKLLRKQSTWKQVIDCYNETWTLPKREVGACILEVRPDF